MTDTDPNARLEAFSDGVFAFAMTLLIVDVKIPSIDSIQTTQEFWAALYHIVPSIAAFILSFAIILITWVNHHAGSKLIAGTSVPFIYANGFLLLTVVFLPFPTALLGATVLTDHASPAVILYNVTMAMQAIGWSLVLRAVIKGNLSRSAAALKTVRQNRRYGFVAVGVYSAGAVIAIWLPLPVAIATVLIWAGWLVVGLNMKEG